MKRKPIKQLVKELNQSTLTVRKKGKHYIVRDAVDPWGGGKFTAKQLRRTFG